MGRAAGVGRFPGASISPAPATAGAVERTRTSTPFGRYHLKVVRLPISPRPQLARSCSKPGRAKQAGLFRSTAPTGLPFGGGWCCVPFPRNRVVMVRLRSVCASPCGDGRQRRRRARGGRAMRPRFGPAIADRPASSAAGPSRWTHRVGVVQPRASLTPPPAMPSDLACRWCSPCRSRAAVQARGIASSPSCASKARRPSMQGEGNRVAACRDRWPRA